MFKVSDSYKNEIGKLGGRCFVSKVVIRDTEYNDDNIIDMSLNESVNPGDNFSLGSVASNTFEINLIDLDNNVIFEEAIVKPYIGLELDNKIEYIPLGVFTVDDVAIKDKKVKLECVDNMIKLERAYFSDLKYPVNINEVLKEICKKSNIACKSVLPNYSIDEIKGYSFRQAIGIIATLVGCFARFNRIGELEIISYEDTDLRITPDTFFKFETNDKDYIVGKITAKKGEKTFSKGSNTEIIIDNPVITENIVNDLYNKFKDFTYRPYILSWQGNPAVQAGDRVTIVDLDGKEYNTLIMEQKFIYNGGIKSELKASGKTESSDKFDSKGSITQAMENYSIEQAAIKVALIKKADIDSLNAIDARINNLYAQDLTVLNAKIRDLQSTKISTIEFNALEAKLQHALIGKANVNELNVAVERVGILEGKTLSVENQLAGNLTAKNFKANSITAGSGIIAEGAIGSAQISDLELNKLRAGDISTSKFRIISANGSIQIVGNQILVNRDNINRVILGEYRKQDNTSDYGLLIRAKDGKTVMIDSEGVHNAGITDGAINNNKVADNANIAGNKLDINSVIREVNGATETIKGTRVQVGDRTLDIELSTQNNTITEHGKELSTQKASIQALDKAIKLKVDNQTFTQSTETIKGNINSLNSDLVSKINSSLNNAKSYADASANNTKVQAVKQANSNTINAINNIDIGGENLLSNSNKIVGESSDREFIQFADIAPIIDKYGLVKYTISFDIKSKNISKSNMVACYCQNGSGAKYDIGYNMLKVTTEFKRMKVTFIPRISNPDLTVSFLAFYGTYDTGNIPVVKNVKIELGQFATTYSLSIEDFKKYSDNVAKAKADLAQANAIANADGKITAEEQKRIQQAQSNLNTAISKANEAESKAKAYADSKKEEAINTASTDATNKANNALNSAKEFTTAQITTTNSNLSKATSEINILKEQINTKVGQADIDRSIQDIKIGGRNLADNIKIVTDKINDVSTKLVQAKDSLQASVNSLNSTTQTITTNLTNTTNDLNNKISIAKTDAINSSKSYADTKKNEAIVGARKIPDTRNDNQTPDWYMGNYPFQTITEFKFARVVKIPNANNNYNYGTLETKVPWNNSSGGYPTQIFRSSDYPTYQRYGISGTVWSEWEQIEDTQGSQSKADIALNNAKTYTNTQITRVNTRVSNAESSLKLLKDEISTKVSQSDIDKVSTSINNKITSVTEKINTVESTLTQKTNNINATVSNVQSILNTKADGSTVSSVQNQLASLNINVNGISQKVTDNTNRLKSAELKLEPKRIFAAVNSTLAGGDSIGTILSLTNKDLTVYNTDNTSVVVGQGMVKTFDNEGNMSAKLGNNQIAFYDWIDNTGDILGQILSTKTSSTKEKGLTISGGDYANYLSLCFDENWGSDNSFTNYIQLRKKSIVKVFKDISIGGNDIQNVRGINNLLDKETWINRLYIQGAQVNTNASDNNLWLNYWRGSNTTNSNVNVRIGDGGNKGVHGGLVVGDLWVHGSKHRIVDCGDLGFIGMEAYETATPYFGDIGHGTTNEDGECYIIFDKEFIEISNTSIDYIVIVQDEGKTKDTWAKPIKKNVNGFLVKGSPNTPFSYEIKAIQKGFEKNRFKRLDEERSLKTNFGINDHLMKEKETYKNAIKGITVMDDIEENRRLRYKSLFTNKEENKAMEILNYTKGLKLNG